MAEADDRAVWSAAGSGGYLLVTHDSDFADLVALLGPPPKVLWLRTGNQSTAMIERTLRLHCDAMEAFGKDPDASCLELY